MSDYEVDFARLDAYANDLSHELSAAIGAHNRASLSAFRSAMPDTLTAASASGLADAWFEASRAARLHAESHPEGLAAIARAYSRNDADAQTAIRGFFEGRTK